MAPGRKKKRGFSGNSGRVVFLLPLLFAFFPQQSPAQDQPDWFFSTGAVAGIARAQYKKLEFDQFSGILRISGMVTKRFQGNLALGGAISKGELPFFSYEEFGVRFGTTTGKISGKSVAGGFAGFKIGALRVGDHHFKASGGDVVTIPQDLFYSMGLFGEYFRSFGGTGNAVWGIFFEQKFIPLTFTTTTDPVSQDGTLSIFYFGLSVKGWFF